MDYFNIHLDDAKNDLKSSTFREVNSIDSKIKILVIPTNEELEIAKQVFDLLS